MQGLYTIPAGTPFLDALAKALLANYGGDPAVLSSVRLFLPTRRACQAMADAFLRASDGAPLLLPRLEPLGDIDPEDWHEPVSAASAAADLPPAISQTRRQLLLAQLVLKRGGATPDQALKLAAALGQWLDQVQIHGLEPDGLANLVPDEYARHWEQTLEFLKIITHFWPEILRQQGVMDPVERRQAIIGQQIRAWQAAPPEMPVIAAGSTGSLPATAALMRAILDLPQGSVVLPGLDTGLPDDAWAALPEGHPQKGLGELLQSLERAPGSVAPLQPGPGPEPEADPHAARRTAGRAALLRHALMPADLGQPLAEGDPAGAGLDGLAEVVTPGPEAEARVIALRLRQFLDETADGETAALVTPDRGLAKRVAAELRRWRIDIDDSAGEPLGETVPGTYLRLVARAVVSRFEPVPLLALLKHPLAAVSGSSVAALETLALRGIRPAGGIDGLRQALDPAAHEKAEPGALAAAAALVDRLEAALMPLSALAEGAAGRDEEPDDGQDGGRASQAGLHDWLTAHVEAAEALAATEDAEGAARLWAEESGEAAAAAIDGLFAAAADFPDLPAADYPAVFDELIAAATVRPRYGKHPRLAILGPLEARLQCPDLAILGGLVEGTWPPEPARDPWMGRPMRRDFGLPLPEWRIGLAAHDFCQAMAAPAVMMTRADKVAGAPTVPSRWLGRLELAARQVRGLTGKDDHNPLHEGAETWLNWADALDDPGPATPLQPPEARPPVEARLTDLSVTGVERWVGDPYGHYAAAILKLRALDPVDQPPDTSDRGSLLHRVLHRFIASTGGEWPDDARQRLEDIGREVFGPWLERPNVRAFWWPRFLRMADWFITHEAERRPMLVESKTETRLATNAGGVSLSARVDRLDTMNDGALAIIDYKSGALPTTGKIDQGWPPQLPLEAAMARRMLSAEVASIEAWGIGGTGEGGKVQKLYNESRKAPLSPADAGEAAWQGLQRLLAQFADPSMPYLAEPRPRPLAPRFSDYRHLARIDREGMSDD